MIASSSRPYGVRLRGPRDVKLKGINLTPPYPTTLPPTWADLWGSSYNWTGILKRQVDLAVGLGANSVRIFPDLNAVIAGDATQLSRYRQFLDYCDTQGLLTYWALCEPERTDFNALGFSNVAAGMQTVARMLNDYGNVVGIDIINEMQWVANSNLTTMKSWMDAFTGPVKAVTSIPVTYSHNITDSTGWADSLTQLFNGYVDFHSFHPYYGPAFDTLTRIPVSDVNAYRALGYNKPFLIGECGGSLASGPTAQQNRWADGGALSALDDCWGVLGWCLADYNDTRQMGIYDNTYANPRGQLTVPFSTWPARK